MLLSRKEKNLNLTYKNSSLKYLVSSDSYVHPYSGLTIKRFIRCKILVQNIYGETSPYFAKGVVVA